MLHYYSHRFSSFCLAFPGWGPKLQLATMQMCWRSYLHIILSILCSLTMYLTSIAGLVHVNDLDLPTQILVSPCHTCSVYTEQVWHGETKIWVGRSRSFTWTSPAMLVKYIVREHKIDRIMWRYDLQHICIVASCNFGPHPGNARQNEENLWE